VRSLSYLKPSESLTEVVAGLIMVLTFTLGASVLSGGGGAALVGAIGCNVAWGIIDGVHYMMASTFDRNRNLRFSVSAARSLRPRTKPPPWPRSVANSTPIWHR
jgi:hypothetical protein